MSSFAELPDTFVTLLRRGFTWWLGELAALIPRRFAADPAAAPAILDVSTADATLVLVDRGSPQPTRIAITGQTPDLERAEVQSAIRRRATNAVIVRLDQSLVLDASISLPLTAERSLRPILRNQLERLVPLSADEVEFEYQIVTRSTANKTISVRLVIATHASIERALAIARSVGLTPRSIIAAGAGNETITLWRAGRADGTSSVQRRLHRTLEVAAVLLLVTAYVTYVYRLGEMRDQLLDDVAAATRASSAARDLLNRNVQTEKAVAVLQRQRREVHPLMLLDELTQLVPQTTWISQLIVRGRNIELIGYSPRVAELISRIENHELFFDPKFLSPITMSPDGKGERFDLSLSVWVEDVK